MPIAPEEVRAPARDAVLFRASPGRTFLMMFVVLMVAYLAVSPVIGLIAGDTGDPWWAIAIQAMVVGGGVAGGYAVSARAALQTWIRVSSGGLEIASQESDPILLDWADVADAAIHRQGLRTVLKVTPVDLDSVHPVQAGAAGGPALTDTSRGPAFVADLTQIWPGPRALRRELDRHLKRG
ncbi:hypothetical protein [Actinoplanes couchii]|uniref:PH domain-containing protein n=1 Tax=Actinoplanes couchii TaxID=403638 RepID=A0ABQ3X6H3_9ACTN|nr:hypothetical protein [Actinoplanes couchii]MDR6325178.1 hypothetical protein [Actinoplanes couchii]GID54115.1 hypothetical protein Aco03nite_025190 [Actinoplanes couchii]